MIKNLVIINYGMGNLYSIFKAIKHLNIPIKISNRKKDIENAAGLILPGVGAFGDAMKEIYKQKLFDVIKKEVKKGKPILGICLGFQLLFTKSYEFGIHNGFDFIKGEVVRFKKVKKVPHIGWNSIKIINSKNKIFKNIINDTYFYFVHSYFVVPYEKRVIIATTKYGNTKFVSAIEKENIFGMQFHPEKSGEKALLIYKNFYNISTK